MTESTRQTGESETLPATVGSKPIVELSLEQQRALEQRRTANFMAAQIANLSWGKNLDQATRRAVADFCHRYGVEPLTEFDLLGGSPYINSDYWLRRLGELRQQGIIADFWLDHIEADDRLARLMMDEAAPRAVREQAVVEWYRRVNERIKHAAPEQAEGICVCNIVLASGGHPVQGVKWGGGGTSVMQPRSGGGSAPNPIVEANPELSVESQSVRRAMRQVASYIPAMAAHFEQMDAELADLGERTRAAHAAGKASATADEQLGQGWVALPAGHDDPYGLGTDKEAPRALGVGAAEPVAVVERAAVSAAAAAAAAAPAPVGGPRESALFQDDSDIAK